MIKLLNHQILVWTILLTQAAMTTEVCLFDEQPDFAAKLFRATDGSTAVVKDGDPFIGKLSLNVTPVLRGCEFVYDRSFIWEYAIAEKPVAGEFRYILFAWKKAGGKSIQIGFYDDRPGTVLTYYAGEMGGYKTRSEAKYIQAAESVPSTWQYIIRDMYSDIGGVHQNFLINGVYFIAGDGESADFDCIYLSDSREALEKIAAAYKEGAR